MTARRFSPAAVNNALDMRTLCERYGASFQQVQRGIMWARCPLPDHNEKTPSFTVRPHTNHFYCYGCGQGGDPLRFIQLMEGWTHQSDFPKALETGAQLAGVAADIDPAEIERIEKVVAEKRAHHQQELEAERQQKAVKAKGRWLAAQASFRGTVAETYLRERRGLDLDRLGPLSAIRFEPKFRWNVAPAGAKAEWIERPALITAMVRAKGAITAVHCTALEPDGSDCQRNVAQKGRAVFGSPSGASMHLFRGASMRSHRDAMRAFERDGEFETIALAEGLEDTLSVALLMPEWRCWAAYSLGNFGRVEPPAYCGELVLCGENDETVGARKALQRAEGQQLELSGDRYTVRTARPPQDFKDWNAVYER